MPTQYLILRPAGDTCRNTEVVFYDSEKQSRDVLFTGKRWAARRGHPPACHEIQNDGKI